MKIIKIYIYILAFFLSSLIVCSQTTASEKKSTPPKTLTEYIKEGKSLANRYFYQEAKDVYEEGLKFYPNEWTLHWYFIDFILKLEYRTAQSYLRNFYEQRLKQDPNNPCYYAGAAMVYIQQYKFKKAKELTQQARDIEKNSLAALHVDAIITATEDYSSDLTKRIKGYEKLFELYPNYSEGYINFFDKFKYDYSTFDTPGAGLENLFDSSTKKKRGKVDFDAIYQKALKCPDIDPIIYTYDKKYESIENYYDKKEIFLELHKKILEIDPSKISSKFSLANTYAGLGQREQQINMLKEISEEAPNNHRAKAELAKIYFRDCEYDQSIEIFKNLIKTLEQLSLKSEDDKTSSPITAWFKSENKYLLTEIQFPYVKSLYRSGKIDEAKEFLDGLIQKEDSYMPFWADNLLNAFKNTKDNKVKIIKGIPYLTQKIDYCGPASLSMILQYWGIDVFQDEIAKDVFSKGMGSDLKATDIFAKKYGFKTIIFSATGEIWKKLIDLDIPIFWVKNVWDNKTHAVVVSGYDDFSNEFIIHDPNIYYDSSEPQDILTKKGFNNKQQSTQCLLLIPEDKINKYDLSFIKSSPFLNMFWYFQYILTGSAIKTNFAIGLFIHLLYAFICIGFATMIIKKGAFPYKPKTQKFFILFALILELLVNILNFKFNSSFTVTILLAYHMSLLLFIIASLLLFLFSYKIIQSYMRWNEYIGFFIAIVMMSAVLGIFRETSSHKTKFAISIFLFLTTVIILLKFFYVSLFGAMLMNFGKYSSALKLFEKYGTKKGKNRWMFLAALNEASMNTNLNNYDKAIAIHNDILEFPYLSVRHKNRLNTDMIENYVLKMKDTKIDLEPLKEKISNLAVKFQMQQPKKLDAAYFNAVYAHYLILVGDYDKAKPLAEETRRFFEGNINAHLIALETIRTSKSSIKRTKFLNDLNLLHIAIHENEPGIIKQLTDKNVNRFNLDFRREFEFYNLIQKYKNDNTENFDEVK